VSEATSDGQPRPNDTSLLRLVERIESVQSDIDEMKEDQKEIFAEAKSNGFDVKIIRKVLAIRRQDKAKRAEELALTETYLHSLGML
jgi:uncharacterized protein (UPF0335 family)